VKRSQELRQKAAKKTKALGDLLEKVSVEARAYTDDEVKQKDALKAEIADLEARATDAEFVEARAQDDADNGEGVTVSIAGGNPSSDSDTKEMRKAVSDFRFVRGLHLQLRKKNLDGLEAEMTQEAQKEARGFGGQVEGVAVPASFMEEARQMERRAATVGTSGNAGVTVDTQMQNDMIRTLRPTPSIIGLGARRLEGLTSDVEFVRATANTVSSWKGETATADETDAAFELLEMSPKRLTAFTEFSRQLLIQSSIPDSVEMFLREDLNTSDELALDLAAITGSGVGSIPEGVMNTTGINDVVIGANGGAATRDLLIECLEKLALKNVKIESLAWLFTPRVMTQLMKTKLDAGSGKFLLENLGDTLLGFPYTASTQVPADGAKGTGTDLNALIFGNFRELIVGSWGGRQVIMNPYSKDKEGMVRLTTHGYHDVGVRRPGSFSVIRDIDVS
jgi:HK97 family phage major capsid protein